MKRFEAFRCSGPGWVKGFLDIDRGAQAPQLTFQAEDPRNLPPMGIEKLTVWKAEDGEQRRAMYPNAPPGFQLVFVGINQIVERQPEYDIIRICAGCGEDATLLSEENSEDKDNVHWVIDQAGEKSWCGEFVETKSQRPYTYELRGNEIQTISAYAVPSTVDFLTAVKEHR